MNSIFNSRLTVSTLYKSDKDTYFMSLSSPLISMPNSRYSVEYVSIHIMQDGSFLLEDETESNIFFDNKIYERDKRIFSYDYKTMKYMNKEQDFLLEVKRLEDIHQVLALVYLWFNFFVNELSLPFSLEDLKGDISSFNPSDYANTLSCLL